MYALMTMRARRSRGSTGDGRCRRSSDVYGAEYLPGNRYFIRLAKAIAPPSLADGQNRRPARRLKLRLTARAAARFCPDTPPCCC